MPEINLISVLLVLIFLLPVVAGAFRPFSRERIYYSFEALFDYLEFLFGLMISIYIVKMVYFEHDQYIYKKIYELIPANVKTAFMGRDMLVYLLNVPFVLLGFIFIIRPFKVLLFEGVIERLAEKLYGFLNPLNQKVKFILGGLVQLPRSVFIVLIAGLLLNFYTYYVPIPQLSRWMNDSGAYNFLYKQALYPILNSSVAKKIPVLLNDSFKMDDRSMGLQERGINGNSIVDRIAQNLAGKNTKVIEYFNGVTLDEAIKSSPEIDDTARRLVKGAGSDYARAELVYKWVARNIRYDTDKAERVSTDPKGISSGSVVAFNTRKGICFDYSCLYISMCRAVGLKVRLVTGLGYSGVSWGDHAWNQVYSADENRWVNVDTTFGTMADYFDKPDFNLDHKYAEIQGEW